MRVLITGGAGFIGSNLAFKLHSDGYDVYIIDDLSTGKLENIPFISERNIFIKDVNDYEFLMQIIKEYQFEYIIHLAAMVSVVETVQNPKDSNEVNINASLSLLELNRQHNKKIKKIFFASSAAIYGDLPKLPKYEDDMINPLSPYAVQKYASEQYFKMYSTLYDIPTVAIRFFNVFGPKQNPNSQYSGVLSILKNKFDHKLPFTFYGDGSQTRDFIYIDDLVSLITLVLFNEDINGQIINGATGNSTDLNTIFKIYEKFYGYSIPHTYEAFRNGDIHNSVASIEKAKKLGFLPKYSIEEGISAYLNY
ncbi:GDP-mannose 4,6-dehydratase [Macrococcus armenti]|uniref:GDP-mannose 4,6-dehydratase n=1 Tax=Macrococcus armenti TaxID=2875764 RepID=UPI001CCB6892|nr:GDP-mannose 4,6-dehydratase [Macrococcus armenti]UBH16106.1 GDP-mannose 4,6-dehydratase [Macrococcus armenti]UBH18466.1 GDP-mannose 4,6-dehydratase [Macrococcus armenti]UBH20733.1 GDP-mannose 4,6-dehydratase [Macrococcus armenti]